MGNLGYWLKRFKNNHNLVLKWLLILVMIYTIRKAGTIVTGRTGDITGARVNGVPENISTAAPSGIDPGLNMAIKMH